MVSFVLEQLLLVAALSHSAQAGLLNPPQDILLPASSSASTPLTLLGANSPWFAGPSPANLANTPPSTCSVSQAIYVTRHGSRYPDNGAYQGWVALQAKIADAGKFTARGELAFIKDWVPVLNVPTVQIAQESVTGYKESYDMGYALRTRYPSLYTEGTKFLAWANLYPRVVQTARMFLRGFLGPKSDTLGTVITVNSTGSPLATGNSLSPGDLCPAYVDGNGGTQALAWDAIYLPPIVNRLNRLLSGNLTFTAADVSQFPYLCGFESQITGALSPWCGTFTEDELKNYEYRQDLRYYYGQGPGTPAAEQNMMLPFLSSVVGLLAHGPGIQGKDASGAAFTLPNLIAAFANDGQLSSLAALVGVFDDQKALSGTKRPSDKDWKYVSSHFVSMRGTVAFERLECAVSSYTGGYHGKTVTKNETFVRVLLNDAVYPVVGCDSGPGKSCPLASYESKIANKVAKAGNWVKTCNVTNPAAPKNVLGAEFLTNLGLSWLASVTP